METGKPYHIITKSIAKYVIFNNEEEFLRMKQLLQYYQVENPPIRFSYSLTRQKTKGEAVNLNKKDNQEKKMLVQIIAYCLMPTHIHLLLQQSREGGISIYINRVLNSYSRYFNTKHHREGPLWAGRFKRVLVETDEQLIHLTRYIHLNPVTAYLVDKPELWLFSSYDEYLMESPRGEKICEFKHILEINPVTYKKFVDDQISYQRKIAAIKNLILE